MLVDTHCHIHEADYPIPVDEVFARAQQSNVQEMLCVGTNLESSHRALEYAARYDHISASIGVHPHDTQDGYDITPLFSNQVAAVGEIGLDYFYRHSPRETQIAALHFQIQAALDHDVPIIFHVRDAFADFWPIIDSYQGIRGVLHSFTDTTVNMEAALARGLYIGVNGISTFTKDVAQKEMFAAIPLTSLLLETDAPFLTPAPLRGKVNEPAFVAYVAEHHAKIRGISFDKIATATTANARALFAL